MKKRWLGLFGLILAALLIAGFTRTYNTPTRKDRIHSGEYNKHIANLSSDLNGLVTEHNTNGTTLGTATTDITALETLLTYGYIDLDLGSWRELDATGDVAATANGAGFLSSDTTPVYEAITNFTKLAPQINWTSSNNDPLMRQMMLPYDFSDSTDVTVEFRVSSDGTTDAVGFTIAYYFNEGDVTGDVTTDTNSTTSFTTITATIPAADVTTDSENLTLTITPFAHTTDKLYLSGARLKYERDL